MVESGILFKYGNKQISFLDLAKVQRKIMKLGKSSWFQASKSVQSISET